MLLTPAQIKPKSETELFFLFFTRGGCASCLRACLGARLLPQSYQYPNLSKGADRAGGQLRGDKECPFSGVTKSGRVWRKVPESGARSVTPSLWLGQGNHPAWLTTALESRNLASYMVPEGRPSAVPMLVTAFWTHLFLHFRMYQCMVAIVSLFRPNLPVFIGLRKTCCMETMNWSRLSVSSLCSCT